MNQAVPLPLVDFFEGFFFAFLAANFQSRPPSNLQFLKMNGKLFRQEYYSANVASQ